MLKKVKKLQKELLNVISLSNENESKYSLSDWSEEDIRKVIFPKDREYFDPDDKDLMQKWNETDWNGSPYLSLLTVPELLKLESWLSGEQHAEK